MQIGLEGVSKSLGSGARRKLILNNVSWRANSGTILGILGPNGTGKTTMIRILLGLLPTDTGHAFLSDAAIPMHSRRFRQIVGYLPEERSLHKNVRPWHAIQYFGILKGLSRKAAAERANQLVEQFELTEHAHKRNANLSKGLAQRVQIACALVHEPSVLILDEPFYGLDPLNSHRFREMLDQRRDQDLITIVCSHEMREVELLCDAIVMLNCGSVVLQGSTNEVRRRFSNGEITIQHDSPLPELDCAAGVRTTRSGSAITLHPGSSIFDLYRELADRRLLVSSIEETLCPLEEVFIKTVQQGAQ
jgi:ABC-2 type transport system ATP-binding protein